MRWMGGKDGGGEEGGKEMGEGDGGDGKGVIGGSGVLGMLTHPRRVKQILIRRSAPQPAMKKTPRGGTVREEYHISAIVLINQSGRKRCVLKIVMITTTIAERTILLRMCMGMTSVVWLFVCL